MLVFSIIGYGYMIFCLHMVVRTLIAIKKVRKKTNALNRCIVLMEDINKTLYPLIPGTYCDEVITMLFTLRTELHETLIRLN